jgi:hypothetical protein
VLRAEAGRNPYDKALSALVGELSTRSEDFRTRWAAHNVHLHSTGTKLINHPVVGRLKLMYDTLQLTADTGLTMLVYTAEPGSPTQHLATRRASTTREPSKHTSQENRSRRLPGGSMKALDSRPVKGVVLRTPGLELVRCADTPRLGEALEYFGPWGGTAQLPA